MQKKERFFGLYTIFRYFSLDGLSKKTYNLK